ncbi:hypothetical protein [Psychromonas ossibalaenae]|uniref:hypothetical protein n=1 Tax=Psychromonas ossibalaenae TaxID=444922 RepID=UPI0003647704|nr:hypothetical protein [Psychromonas ossibalaenae]
MSQSIYLKLAALLIKIDIYTESQRIRSGYRRAKFEPFYASAHMLKDIGLDNQGYALQTTYLANDRAARTVRHLRRLQQIKFPT